MNPKIIYPIIGLLLINLLATCSWAAQAISDSVTNNDNVVGKQLQESFIWTREPTTNDFLYAGFRRDFEIATVPVQARINIFAYTRYQLFVNGEYVGRGPNRFENRRPEYDTWDLAGWLHKGRNVIAVLVHRDWPGEYPTNTRQTLSRIRRHDPGFTALLEMQAADGKTESIFTDSSWRAFIEAGFSLPPGRHYSSIPDSIDARKSPGDWHAADFDDQKLPAACMIATTNLDEWPVLSPRSIPLLRESDIPFTLGPTNATEKLKSNQELVFHCRRIVQAYWVLDIDAVAGSKLVVTPLLPEGKKDTPSIYICRAGRQEWIGGDTFALNALSVRLESGQATVQMRRLVEVLYPFDLVGSFSCSDPLLNQIWQLTASSLKLLSEDSYTDCADRERSEWMDCDPPMYDATRVMMAGPAVDGSRVWSDPRLFANLLLRVALTQEPDGMVRARTCSELRDIHTRMEDRACDWVEGLRKYYEATGDKKLIRDLWPYCDRLLQWFAEHRTADGLIRAREWIAWDNPMSYVTGEGAANNAFIYRAFADGAWLAGEIGNVPDAAKWSRAADDLYHDFNALLWDKELGAYYSSAGTPELLPADLKFKRRPLQLQTVDGHTEPTLHANLFALDQGLVSLDRRSEVVAWVLAHDDQIKQIMANHYYFKLLYGLDEEKYDLIVLDRIRHGWEAMAKSPWQTTWEGLSGGSKVHCYGIVPGYFLSAYVLGVRRDAPVWRHQLVIEPHLADLTHAEGVVSTEFGGVPVAWKKEASKWHFKVTVPENTEALLGLPNQPHQGEIRVDDGSLKGTIQGSRCVFKLKSGPHEGYY